MKKMLILLAAATLLALPMSALAAIVGDCYDCHTMHNSESGAAVAQEFDAAASSSSVTGNAVPNLLKFDCLACHANDPAAGSKIMTLPGGSDVPQVAHGDATGDLAGGNFSYGLTGSNATVDKVHNIKELFSNDPETYTPVNGNPPGMITVVGSSHQNAFTTGANAFDQFSCAGARGCHGTRNQLVEDGSKPRQGMAAITGAHHDSTALSTTVASNYTLPAAGQPGHDGAKVNEGYRFIPGLKGLENPDAANPWQNVDANSHNEYYGVAGGFAAASISDCSLCHTGGGAATTIGSSMSVPNNTMSGFCSTCHGNFHSSGVSSDPDSNGTSGAFLRHPSDYIIPNSGEYTAYTAYDVSAPVARSTLPATVDATVTPGTDLVMCLSCHAAHGTENDYILRFDYTAATAMEAGIYVDQATAQAQGGCLACHTLKGVQQ